MAMYSCRRLQGSAVSTGSTISSDVFAPFAVMEEDEDEDEDEDSTLVQTIPTTSTEGIEGLALDPDDTTAGETSHSILSSTGNADTNVVGYASAMDLYEMDNADDDSNANEETEDASTDGDGGNDDTSETVSKVNNYASAMDLYSMDNEDTDEDDHSEDANDDDADDVDDGGDRKHAGDTITQTTTPVNLTPPTSELPSTKSKPPPTTFSLPPTATTPPPPSSSTTTTPKVTTVATSRKANVVEQPVKESRSWRRNSKGRRNSKDEQVTTCLRRRGKEVEKER